MTEWVRLWHDMPTDPKWRVIARKSGQPLACVLAVFTMMLTNASGNAASRGTLLAWDNEDAGAALDMDAEDVEAIYAAMQGKVLDGDRLTGWERRQPKREDNSADRVKAYRERQKTAKDSSERTETQDGASVTQCNAPETDTETDIIPSNDGIGALRPEHVVEAWNDMAKPIGLPVVRKLTPDRRRKLLARIKQNTIEDFTEAIAKVEASPFLRGERGWTGADFDFLLSPVKFQKIIEGSYDR